MALNELELNALAREDVSALLLIGLSRCQRNKARLRRSLQVRVNANLSQNRLEFQYFCSNESVFKKKKK